MVELFEYRNGHVFPSVQALLLRPYKDIWENDMSDGRVESVRHFSFIYFTCFPSKRHNPFWGYNDDERADKVKERVYGSKDYQIPLEIMQAILAYKEDLQNCSPSYSMVMAGLSAAQSVKKFLNDPLIMEKKLLSGAPMMKPKDVMLAIKEIESTITNLETLLDKVGQELTSSSKTRKDREVNKYEE